jgi:hypothetical protein
METLKKSYKFLSVDKREINVTSGNYLAEAIVPFGPEHEDIEKAEIWLSVNAVSGKKYLLVPLYSIKK